jgi:hypothetical protein
MPKTAKTSHRKPAKTEPAKVVPTWRKISGDLIFGNLAIENDEQARVAVFTDRKQFDLFCIREGIDPSKHIEWRAV